MGGLPLALDQAGAYLEETKCSLDEFLYLFRNKSAELLKQRGEYTGSHYESVGTTFSLALKKVQQISLEAADLLMLCAFLAPDGIPEEIFSQLPSGIGTSLESFADNKLSLNNAIKSLLVRREAKGGMPVIIVHRLVQAVIRDTLSDDEKMVWIDTAIKTLNGSLSDIDEDKWMEYELWISNAITIASYIREWHISSVEAVELLCETGVYLRALANYKEAEHVLLLVLEMCENEGDSNLTAFCKNLLATIYSEWGKHKEAENLYQEALELFEKSPESKAIYILYTQAELYFNRGKYVEVEPLYEKVLEHYKQQFGIEHPATRNCMNNLGMLYKFWGKYKEAQKLLEEILAYRKRFLGISHPYTAISLSNLGDLFQEIGRYNEAETLYQQALAVREKILGLDHPDTALSLNNLAGTYESLGVFAHENGSRSPTF